MTYERNEAQLTKGKETQTGTESGFNHSRVSLYAQRFVRHTSPRDHKITSTRGAIRSSRSSPSTHFYRNNSKRRTSAGLKWWNSQARFEADRSTCRVRLPNRHTASLPRQRTALRQEDLAGTKDPQREYRGKQARSACFERLR
jgi:hypothetical protein